METRESLMERINGLTAKTSPLLEPGDHIEGAIKGYTYTDEKTKIDVYVPGIRDALIELLDNRVVENDIKLFNIARNKIYDLRDMFDGNNNSRVSNSYAKGAATRAMPILNDIINFKLALPAEAPAPAPTPAPAPAPRNAPPNAKTLPPGKKPKIARKTRKRRKTRSRK